MSALVTVIVNRLVVAGAIGLAINLYALAFVAMERSRPLRGRLVAVVAVVAMAAAAASRAQVQVTNPGLQPGLTTTAVHPDGFLGYVQDVGGEPVLTYTLPVRGSGTPFSGATEQVSDPVDGIIYRIQGSDDLVDWTGMVISEVAPALDAWELVLAMGLLGTFAHLLMTWSLRFAPASTLAPMQYLEIPVAAVIGYVIFSDFPDGLALAGIAVTIAAGLYIVLRERAVSRRSAPPSPVPAPPAV